MSQTSSRVGKLREDAYFSELDQQLLADLHELMVEAGEAVHQGEDEKLEQDRHETLSEAAIS
jgi:hypothetical protein